MKKQLNKIYPVPTGQYVLWMLIRALLFAYGIYGLFTGSVTKFLMGMFSIAFTHLWDLFQLLGGKSFITRVDYFSQTLLNVFIFVGCVIGPYLNDSTNFGYMDLIEHSFAGILASWFGYDLATAIQGRKHHLKPALAALFSVLFSLSIGAAWEFYEFTMDRIYGYDLQNSIAISEIGLVDTMEDMICCAAGSLVGMFWVAFYKNGIIGKGRKELRQKVKAQSKFDREEELAYLEELRRQEEKQEKEKTE